MDVVTVGEALTVFTAREQGRLETQRDFAKSFGGSEANTAIGLARLGRSVRWVSAVGDDPFGREIVTTLRGEGVTVDRVRTDDRRPTALMVKELRAGQDPRIHYYRHGSAATGLSGDDLSDDLLTDTRRVHLTGITMALDAGPRSALHQLLTACKEHGVPVSFDPNLRRKLQDPAAAVADWRRVFPYVDDLLLSESEAALCAPGFDVEEALRHLASNGFRSVVITRGGDGAIGIEDGTVHEVSAARDTTVVDTVGGGDAFNAGFLHERLHDAGFAQCLATGAWVAGHVVAQRGDWEGLPTRTEYRHWTETKATIRR